MAAMFPVTDDSQTIIDCLLAEARRTGVQIRTSTGASRIDHNVNGTGFKLKLLNEEVLEADRVLVATGGNPQLNAYHWLTLSGHHIESPVPSLFTFNIPIHRCLTWPVLPFRKRQ